MPFPDSIRVIYDKNPLEQVICQIRFPTILRIATEVPAAFQERVRKEYPLYQQEAEVPISLPQEFLEQIPTEIVSSMFRTDIRAHNFTSADELRMIALSKDFLALTFRKYERWEQFRQQFQTALEPLMEIYSPAFFSRTGLRYQNVIRRSDLGLENVKWAELLKPYIAGELAAPESDIADTVKEAVSQVLMQLRNNLGQVRIRHGLVRDDKSGEICYLIDSDFFTDQKTEINHVLENLDAFNRQNRQFFHWCITDRLHSAMGPQRI